jgi:hypothetical protein
MPTQQAFRFSRWSPGCGLGTWRVMVLALTYRPSLETTPIVTGRRGSETYPGISTRGPSTDLPSAACVYVWSAGVGEEKIVVVGSREGRQAKEEMVTASAQVDRISGV